MKHHALAAKLSIIVLILICKSTVIGSLMISNRIQSDRYEKSRMSLTMSAEHGMIQKRMLLTGKNIFIRGGCLSFSEAISSPLVVALHSGRFALLQTALRNIPAMMKSFWPNVRKILNPMDMLIFLTLYLTHVRFLKFLHVITMSLRRKVHKIAVTTEYKESIFGFLERPVTMTIMFLPFVYGLDISNIVMHCLGFDFHIKGDLSRLCCVVYEAVTAGVFITKLKDFLLNLHRLKTFQRHQLAISRGDKVPFHRRDHIREATVDELSSIVVWTFLFGLCLEAMSLEFGFALGSVFALGGIGSASVVLAMRSTMENLIGGLVLKLQDKIRVGEIVTVPGGDSKHTGREEGVVEEVNYIATTIRREDNSVVVVPNQVFSKGEIINWSRTPYRLFKTSVAVKMTDCYILGNIIDTIKYDISQLYGVETLERELVVSATSFKNDMVTIDIETHLKISEKVKEGELKTAVIAAIAKCIQTRLSPRTVEDKNPLQLTH